MLLRLLQSYRFWLCGPLACLLALLVILAMAVWFPKGRGEIDNIVIPLLSFPLIWALVFFYAYLERKLVRVASFYAALFVLQLGVLAYHFSGAH